MPFAPFARFWAVTFVEDKDLGRVCPACVKPLIDADMMLRIMSLSEAMTVSGLGIEAFKSNSCEGCH
jgi:hypothetical protein